MESLKSEKNDYRVRNILAGFALLQMTEMQTAIAADLPTRDKTPEISETIQEQILSTLRIDDVEKFATVTDVIPSTLGKYIIQIDQLHMNSADPKKSETQTAKAQEEIGLLIDYLLKQKPNVKICPESLISVSEYESAKTDFNSLKERFLNAADDTEGLEILKKWIDTKKEKYTPQYVEKLQILSAALYEMTFTKMEKENAAEIQKLNPFGQKALTAGGIIEKKFVDGELTIDNIVPCESLDIGRSFAKLLQELQSKGEDISNDDMERFNNALLAREDFIVQTLNKYLTEDSQSEYIVLVIGAVHDLSDNVLQQNTEPEASTGYLRLRAKTTNEAFERTVGQSEDK